MFKPVDPKPDFPNLEKDLLEHWEKTGLVEKYLKKNSNSDKNFSFLDGPITANNPMGVHHAWGRTYKDLWQRFHNMLGYKQRFQNGFDEQGLWVEVEVEKELGLNSKKEIENLVPGDREASIAKFINLCKERVKKYAAIQTSQSQRLGYFMDWENSYHTSSDTNNYAIWNFLKKVHTDGNLYKGADSVPWCPRCGTAISQHEILTEEYKEINHDTIFFKLPIKGKDKEYLLVWTTTPWTIPANVAVAINPKLQYVKVKMGQETYYLAQDRLTVLEGEVSKPTPVAVNELLTFTYEGPFDHLPLVKETLKGYEHRVIDGGELVTGDEGTGLLHVAPGAGEEDYELAKQYNLPVLGLIEEDASYIPGLMEFSGQNAKAHPGIIIDHLKKSEGGKYLLKTQQIVHRYPTCWRCKSELVWRVVDEWYISVDPRDGKGRDLRSEMISVAKKISWIPQWGKERELDWLKNMHDWLISKKRYWGLALPIYECTKCGHFEVIGSKEELKAKAVAGWSEFEGNSPHRPWVDHVKIKCSNCGEVVSRIPDVGNPWLDAGIVPYSTLPEEWFPADLVGESFPGQFKNWFYSMIAMSTVLQNTNPFKTLFGYASMKDEKGEEMHKSKGNAIWFDEGAEKIGVDVMRWLFVTHNPENNLHFGYNVTDLVRRQFFLLLWNVYKFFVDYARVDNYENKIPTLPQSKNVLDQWILSRLSQLHETMTNSLPKYDMMTSYRSSEDFLQDLSVWYLRRSRDRVGPTVPDSEDKQAFYNTMHFVLTTYVKLLAPAIPFVTDMIYTNLTSEESVHLTDWPEKIGEIDNQLQDNMRVAREIVEKGHSARKESSLKVRQPLKSVNYTAQNRLPEEIESVIAAELNVKLVIYSLDSDLSVKVDTQLTEELKAEGEARELVRMIQEKRKDMNVKFNDQVKVTLPSWPKEFEDYIQKETLSKLEVGNELSVSS